MPPALQLLMQQTFGWRQCVSHWIRLRCTHFSSSASVTTSALQNVRLRNKLFQTCLEDYMDSRWEGHAVLCAQRGVYGLVVLCFMNDGAWAAALAFAAAVQLNLAVCSAALAEQRLKWLNPFTYTCAHAF